MRDQRARIRRAFRSVEHAGRDRAGELKLARQRAAVYAYLASVDSHPTAEDVFYAVRDSLPRISLATVYTALETLVSVGLATRLSVRRKRLKPGT